jgi:hypothetical protein
MKPTILPISTSSRFSCSRDLKMQTSTKKPLRIKANVFIYKYISVIETLKNENEELLKINQILEAELEKGSRQSF